MEVRSYLGTIARYWWLVLLVTISAATAVTVVDFIRSPSYSAKARVAVRPAASLTDERTIVDLVGQMASRSVVGTYAQTFSSEAVKTQARQAASLSSADAARYPLEANILPDSIVIEVSGTGPDPAILANYINATVSSTISNTRGLFKVMELVSLESAQVPDSPTSPVPARDIPLATLLGFAVGLLLALTVDYLRGPRVAVPQAAPAGARVSPYLEVDRR